MSDSSNVYRQCLSLVKGLGLIETMNQMGQDSSTISGLAETTGIHRTTVKRLLETLRAQEYVEYESHSGRYRLSPRVMRLSHGFTQRESLARIAWPTMLRVSKKILWPCTLSSFEGDRMMIRRSTQAYSPFSFHPGTPGRALPMLSTAAGKAYLAFSSEHERSILLEVLEQQGLWNKHDHPAARMLNETLQDIQSLGYSTNAGDWDVEKKFAAFAVPLMHDDRVLLCLAATFLIANLIKKDETARITKALLQARKEIEEKFLASTTTRVF
jgi:IclR family mhp operon transcriptional activator